MLKNKYSAPTRRRGDNKKVKKPAWHISHAIPAPPPPPLGRLRSRGYKLVVLLLFIRVLRRF